LAIFKINNLATSIWVRNIVRRAPGEQGWGSSRQNLGWGC